MLHTFGDQEILERLVIVWSPDLFVWIRFIQTEVFPFTVLNGPHRLVEVISVDVQHR
jgi:hypothetical protein